MTIGHFLNTDCTVQKHRYENGRVALRLVDEEESVATCTVNLPGVALGKNDVLIKDHAENRGMLKDLVATGVVKPTGESVRTGFFDIPVCELQPPFREPTHAEGIKKEGRGRTR